MKIWLRIRCFFVLFCASFIALIFPEDAKRFISDGILGDTERWQKEADKARYGDSIRYEGEGREDPGDRSQAQVRRLWEDPNGERR